MNTLKLAAAAATLCATQFASAVDYPIRTDRLVTGLTFPTTIVFAPGNSQYMYVTEKTGYIRIVDLATNTVLPTPFLNIDSITNGGTSQSSEQGLLGLVFDPNYETNGYFYVNYTGTSGGGDTCVVRYTALSPTEADAASALTIITFDQPFSNHNGGWLDFGPDGYLYISTGDGGSANDPGARAQDITSQPLGKMLRLDPSGDDFPADANKNYAIPPSNPFVGLVGDDEIFFYGLRNPWRCSFDRLTGDLWIGDVGQNAWEEISFAPAGVGGLNFGWRCMEGNSCTGLSGCTCNGPTLSDPVHVYDHGASGGSSVTGGFVYRGCAIPEAAGTYFFCDYGSNRYWSFRLVDGVKTDFTVQTTDFTPSVDGFTCNTVVAWGEDHDGELYVADHGGSTGQGQIFKVIRDPNAAALPDCDTNGNPDTCDIAQGAADCDANGILDSCDIANGAADCNVNGIPDSCDIASGAETDSNGNGIPDSCESVPGDLNGDNVVDSADLGLLLATWGPCANCNDCAGDLNNDCMIDGADVGELLANWTV